MGARSGLGPTRLRIQRRQLAVVALGSVSRLPLFCFPKKIRRVTGGVDVLASGPEVVTPVPVSPKATIPVLSFVILIAV